MKITAPTSLSNVNSTDDLKRFTGIFASQVAQAINANLTFSDNLFAKLLTVNFTTANQTFGINHNLNSIPFGYLLVGSNVALSLFDGNQANTILTIYLQSSAIGIARILVLG